MKSGAGIARYAEDGLIFEDGSKIEADVIIYATGFAGNMRNSVRDLFGDEVAGRVEDFWGLDAEGEIKGAFKPSGRKYCPRGKLGTLSWKLTGSRSASVAARRDVRPGEVLFALHCLADPRRVGWDAASRRTGGEVLSIICTAEALAVGGGRLSGEMWSTRASCKAQVPTAWQ